MFKFLYKQTKKEKELIAHQKSQIALATEAEYHDLAEHFTKMLSIYESTIRERRTTTIALSFFLLGVIASLLSHIDSVPIIHPAAITISSLFSITGVWLMSAQLKNLKHKKFKLLFTLTYAFVLAISLINAVSAWVTYLT